MTILNSEQIEAILPHKSPLLMVDSLLTATSDRIEATLHVKPDNFFLEQSNLSGYGLIEHIAQSGAVGLVMLNGGESALERPTGGFLAGLSKLVISHLPRVGDTIRTVLEPAGRLGAMHLLRAESHADSQLLVSCEIKLTIQINGNEP